MPARTHTVGKRELDGLLLDWANTVLDEIECSSLPKETVIYKIMKNGVRVDTGIIPIPNYWPKPELIQVNDAIWSLPIIDRNALVLKYIFRKSYQQIGTELSLSKSGAYKRLDKITWKIFKHLKK